MHCNHIYVELSNHVQITNKIQTRTLTSKNAAKIERLLIEMGYTIKLIKHIKNEYNCDTRHSVDETFNTRMNGNQKFLV